MNEIHFDFEAFLTLASFLTGMLWVYALIAKRKNKALSYGLNIIDSIGSFFSSDHFCTSYSYLCF